MEELRQLRALKEQLDQMIANGEVSYKTFQDAKVLSKIPEVGKICLGNDMYLMGKLMDAYKTVGLEVSSKKE